MRIPVLAYHSHRALGSSYDTNDHLALSDDLRTIHTHGFRVVPLIWVVEWVLGRREESTLEKAVAITFDDGADLDYLDLEHPTCGFQRSFYGILCDFRSEVGTAQQPHLHASSFVIASPLARQEIARQGFPGLALTEEWWNKAHNSGVMSIGSHSWDHNHPDVGVVCEENQIKGSFDVIDTYAECRDEIQQAAEYIHQRIAPAWSDLFAYPWGQSSAYLRETYFPNFQHQHRAIAAFVANGGYVTNASSRWNLPRLVCGSLLDGWQETKGLIEILQGEWRGR